MFMFLTRLGISSKAVITGDETQIDLPPQKHSGLLEAHRALRHIEGIAIIEFTKRDIVRHPLVQRIVAAYEIHRGKAVPTQRPGSLSGMAGVLTIRNRQHHLPVDLRLLRGIVRALLRDHLQIKTFDLGCYLVATPEMTRLNETYLRHKGPTDVITFDYADPASLPPGRASAGRRPDFLCGEIFVCVEVATAQARRFRTTVRRRWFATSSTACSIFPATTTASPRPAAE